MLVKARFSCRAARAETPFFDGLRKDFGEPRGIISTVVLRACHPPAPPVLKLYTDRGRYYYADLTVFDEEALKNGTPDREDSFGIEKVFINGCQVLDGGVLDTAALKSSGRAVPVFG